MDKHKTDYRANTVFFGGKIEIIVAFIFGF